MLAAYGLAKATVRPVPGGLINETFIAEQGERRAVVQKLHPVFGAEVHRDIEAVTAHLASKGMLTPRLCRTTVGELWVENDGEIWRALSHVDGSSGRVSTNSTAPRPSVSSSNWPGASRLMPIATAS